MSASPQHSTPAALPGQVPGEHLFRLSVEQYHQMTAAGILSEDDPVELLEGWLVTKMHKTPTHSMATQQTRDALAGVLPANWFVNDQEPITILNSELEPDVTVVRGERRQYRQRHPGLAEIALVVEVSDDSLQRDRTIKQRLYAAAGIRVYWIVNLRDRRIEVYTEPCSESGEPEYRQHRDYLPGQPVPVVVAGQQVGEVNPQDLLP